MEAIEKAYVRILGPDAGADGTEDAARKASSSQNARKHGMRSKKLIVENERQEDFDRLSAGWRAEYGDEGKATESLLERVILGDWFLRRAERRYIDAEAELAEIDALEWSEDQHHNIELYLRYKTTQERSFYRALHAPRGLRKDKIREELGLEKMRREIDQYAVTAVEKAAHEQPVKGPEKHAEGAGAANRTEAVFGGGQKRGDAHGRSGSKKQRELVVLDQWVEVEIEDGKTVTALYPSNEELIKEGQAMERVPDLVYRRLNFPQGIPGEYRWTADADAPQVELGGMGTQRMTVETWLEAIEREAASGTGHIGPTGVGNLPRPKERGGCECEVCATNRELMERRAAA